MSFNFHDYGRRVRVSTEDGSAATPPHGGRPFTDAILGGVIDPDVVKLSVCDPTGQVTTYEYGVDAEVVRDDVGIYHADIDVDQAGDWYYRWFSEGDGKTSDEHRFQVRTARAIES